MVKLVDSLNLAIDCVRATHTSQNGTENHRQTENENKLPVGSHLDISVQAPVIITTKEVLKRRDSLEYSSKMTQLRDSGTILYELYLGGRSQVVQNLKISTSDRALICQESLQYSNISCCLAHMGHQCCMQIIPGKSGNDNEHDNCHEGESSSCQCQSSHCEHNSTHKHLCICKKCRDKIGELFNHLKKSLLHLHFTRREFALLCGYVTCSAEQLHCINQGPRPKLTSTSGLGKSENKFCIQLYFKNENRSFERREVLPVILFGAEYYHCFLVLSFANIIFQITIVVIRNLLLRQYELETATRKNKIIFLSIFSILVSTMQIEKREGYKKNVYFPEIVKHDSAHLGNQKSHRYTYYSAKEKVMEFIEDLQYNYKSKNTKSILYDIINYQQPCRNENIIVYPASSNNTMANEILRVGSMHNFPEDKNPSLIRLAQAGFYYEGKGREVTCFSCGVKHGVWSEGSVPLEIHRQLSPDCTYLKEVFPVAQPGIPTISVESDSYQNSITRIPTTVASPVNVIEADSRYPSEDAAGATQTLLISSSPAPVSVKSSVDSGLFGSSQLSHNSTNAANRNLYSSMLTSASRDSGYGSSGRSFPSNQSSSSNSTTQTRPQLPMVSERPETIQQNVTVPAHRDSPRLQNNRKNTAKEKYPEYIAIERRRATYKNWPPDLTFLHPLDLAECGFFYSNFGDCVRCFHCGIGLRNWESDDNPWVEHARWSRKCPYLLQKKGQEFIDSVLTVLGLQTDAEIEQQVASAASETTSQATSGYVTGSSDVRDPIQHPAAQYIIREQIFGDNKERQVKKTMNQLLQLRDWDDITNDMLVNALLESKDGIETKTNPANLSESAKSNPSSNPEEKNTSEDNKASNEEDPEKIQKENDELKDLYTCKICLDERVGITFVPCGHLVTCKNCSPKIRRCPLCRTFIRGTIKTTI